MEVFEQKLRESINVHSLESESDTPDFILAEYILDCLDAFTDATNKREKWYGRKKKDTRTKETEKATEVAEQAERQVMCKWYRRCKYSKWVVIDSGNSQRGWPTKIQQKECAACGKIKLRSESACYL